MAELGVEWWIQCPPFGRSAMPPTGGIPGPVSMRAANLTRMQAELGNGGGSQYSPANYKHQDGGETCMISNIAAGFRFHSPDGKITKVEYNELVRTNVTL